MPDGVLEPISPWLILPEVREPKNWWGGHMWVDRDQTYIYSFQAYLTDSIWYNSTMVTPEEIPSYNDLLQPKWPGKIGFLDPRTPGAGDSTWALLWMVKGEEYLKKLVAQKLFISRDQRVLAEIWPKERVQWFSAWFTIHISLLSRQAFPLRLFLHLKREPMELAAAVIWRSSRNRLTLTRQRSL